MRSVSDRSPQALFVNERYPSGCTIDNLSDGVLQDLCADSNISTGGALIIQDISQGWAEILRSGFPKFVRRVKAECLRERCFKPLETDQPSCVMVPARKTIQ
jgi:hypothetical protein